MRRRQRNKPIPPDGVAALTALLLEGGEIRDVAAKAGYGVGTVSRIRTKLVEQGLLARRSGERVQPPRHRQPRRPTPEIAAPAAKPASGFIAPIPMARLMAGR
jgi:hypothetical protein